MTWEPQRVRSIARSNLISSKTCDSVTVEQEAKGSYFL